MTQKQLEDYLLDGNHWFVDMNPGQANHFPHPWLKSHEQS